MKGESRTTFGPEHGRHLPALKRPAARHPARMAKSNAAQPRTIEQRFMRHLRYLRWHDPLALDASIKFLDRTVRATRTIQKIRSARR